MALILLIVIIVAVIVKIEHIKDIRSTVIYEDEHIKELTSKIIITNTHLQEVLSAREARKKDVKNGIARESVFLGNIKDIKWEIERVTTECNECIRKYNFILEEHPRIVKHFVPQAARKTYITDVSSLPKQID